MIPAIQTTFWAEADAAGALTVSGGKRPFQMRHSDGTGQPLLSHNGFGADIIHFGAGEGVGNHTHVGDHILFVLKGKGSVFYHDTHYPLHPGLCYFVAGEVDHAISAEEELVILVVGNNHFPVDSAERMTPTKL